MRPIDTCTTALSARRCIARWATLATDSGEASPEWGGAERVAESAIDAVRIAVCARVSAGRAGGSARGRAFSAARALTGSCGSAFSLRGCGAATWKRSRWSRCRAVSPTGAASTAASIAAGAVRGAVGGARGGAVDSDIERRRSSSTSSTATAMDSVSSSAIARCASATCARNGANAENRAGNTATARVASAPLSGASALRKFIIRTTADTRRASPA